MELCLNRDQTNLGWIVMVLAPHNWMRSPVAARDFRWNLRIPNIPDTFVGSSNKPMNNIQPKDKCQDIFSNESRKNGLFEAIRRH